MNDAKAPSLLAEVSTGLRSVAQLEARLGGTLDIWVEVTRTELAGETCIECGGPLHKTFYVHRRNNRKAFCAAICCVIHYLIPGEGDHA